MISRQKHRKYDCISEYFNEESAHLRSFESSSYVCVMVMGGREVAYQALYRKWRPQTFDDVIGQNHIVSTLKNEILSGKTAHAYLFCGTRGTGKTSCAKIFARAMNCENPHNANPCNECSICRGVSEGSVLDIVEIDAASNNGVDNIREIRDEVAYSAAQAKYKIYIIDEVHMLSAGAFNALLKTLEEPPPYVVFILATTEAHKLPPTITSRCQRFDFKRISVKDITLRMREIVAAENIEAEIEALELIARLADGGMRDALSMLDQCISAAGACITRESVEQVLGVAADTLLDDCINAIALKDTGAVLAALAQTVANGKDLTNFTDRLIHRFRDMLVLSTCKQAEKLFDCGADVLSVIEKQVKHFTAAQLGYCIDILTAAQAEAKNAKSVRVVYELAMIRLCDAAMDTSVNGLLARIEALEGQLAGSAPAHVRIVQASPQPTAPPLPVQEAPEAKEDTAPAHESVPTPPPPPPVRRASVKNGGWGEILSALKKIDISLFGILSGCRAKISEGSLYMPNMAYIKALVQSNDSKMQQAINQALGQSLRLKFVSEAELGAIEETITEVEAAYAPTPVVEAGDEEVDPLESLMGLGGDDISFEE